MTLPLSRRHVLQGITAVLAAGAIPAPARAASLDPAALKFVFVYNVGGWDPLQVFAAAFDSPDIDMQPGTERGTVGGIEFVDHGERPSVRAFFEAWHGRTVVLNGVSIPSVSHEVCTVLSLNGTTSGEAADWPARLADARRADYTVPHLVLGGPSFPGDLAAAVSRTGLTGQLQGLVTGDLLGYSDVPLAGISTISERIVDRWLERRAAARAGSARSVGSRWLTGGYHEAVTRATALKGSRYDLNLSSGGDFASRSQVALQALSLGICRCVTLDSGGAWDTHINNDLGQSPLFEALFAGLIDLMRGLETTLSPSGVPLVDETVVVVLSEMGRTPRVNATDGRDHWPFTSVLLVGPGLTGSRVVGAFDDTYFGVPVDRASGDVVAEGPSLDTPALGATLLVLAGIDPADTGLTADPLAGVLDG